MSHTDTTVDVPTYSPSVDVLTNDQTVRVRAELPGVQPDALKLTLHDGVLHLDGLAPSHRFVRRLRLAWPISETADIEATLSDGLLTVDLTRADAPEPVRRVPVA